MSDLISRQAAIDALEQIRYALWEIDIPSPTVPEYIEHHRDVQNVMKRIDEIRDKMERLPSVQPQTAKQTDESAQNVPNGDSISRKAAIDAINTWDKFGVDERGRLVRWHEGLELYVHLRDVLTAIVNLPSAEPEQRYTEEELKVFLHGISLSLLSKRSAQHWKYDKDTATEIKFLERLYDKVVADMRGEQDERLKLLLANG